MTQAVSSIVYSRVHCHPVVWVCGEEGGARGGAYWGLGVGWVVPNPPPGWCMQVVDRAVMTMM